MARCLSLALQGATLALVMILAAPAWADDASLCQQAIADTERTAHLPAHLLMAIGIVESGRPVPHARGVVAWPWTINIAGAGHFYETQAEAEAAVQAAQRSGVQSIDVGCMQINLMHHPHAFANLDEAFDPAANVRYAAAFLQVLYRQTLNWGSAVADYHSATPDMGAAYGQRVAAIWPLAGHYGLANIVPRPSGPSPADMVDPQHVMTPEFRARLIAELAFKQQRDARLGGVVAAPPKVRALRPARGRIMQASLGN